MAGVSVGVLVVVKRQKRPRQAPPKGVRGRAGRFFLKVAQLFRALPSLFLEYASEQGIFKGKTVPN
jgi:hypothetical protein